MRLLKFRAWSPVQKKFLYNGNVGFDGQCYKDVYSDSASAFGTSFGVEISQFTGLQDKNGRDIYEGDIIEYGEYGQEVVEWAYGTDGDGYGVSGFAFNNEVDRENASYGGAVIGNIYENPELLAGTSK